MTSGLLFAGRLGGLVERLLGLHRPAVRVKCHRGADYLSLRKLDNNLVNFFGQEFGRHAPKFRTYQPSSGANHEARSSAAVPVPHPRRPRPGRRRPAGARQRPGDTCGWAPVGEGVAVASGHRRARPRRPALRLGRRRPRAGHRLLPRPGALPRRPDAPPPAGEGRDAAPALRPHRLGGAVVAGRQGRRRRRPPPGRPHGAGPRGAGALRHRHDRAGVRRLRRPGQARARTTSGPTSCGRRASPAPASRSASSTAAWTARTPTSAPRSTTSSTA